jgi:hypothetical protein
MSGVTDTGPIGHDTCGGGISGIQELVSVIDVGPLKWSQSASCGSCQDCAPIAAGDGSPKLRWTLSQTFCPDDSPLSQSCLLTAGKKACPAGYPVQISWFTGANGAASCSCEGCGHVQPPSCRNESYAFNYGSSKGPCTSDVRFTLPATGGSITETTVGGALATTALGAWVVGGADPGTCGQPRVVTRGMYSPIGEQTVCCPR